MRIVAFVALAVVGARAAKLTAAPPAGPHANNTVTQWQTAAETAVARYNISNQLSGRLYASLATAQADALRANAAAPAAKRANDSAVAALAAYRVFVGALPFAQTEVDPLIQGQLAGLSKSDVARAAAVAAGPAARVARAAADNGAQSYANFRPAPADGRDGAYQFAPGQKFTLYPQLANASFFALSGDGAGYVAKELASFKPLALDSAEYKDQLQQVASVGAKESAARTPYQSETAKFWADGDGTPSVAGRYFQIAASLLPANASLQQTADLFARLGAAQADASVAAWNIKYGNDTLFWRPITSLRRAAAGNASNNAANATATWEPLLKTPAHPEFPSGHSVTAGASAAVLEDAFGGDAQAFTTNTAAPGFKARTYTSLKQSVDEVGDSRVWGGVHYNASVLAGRDIGYKVGRDVIKALDGKAGGAKAAAAPAPAKAAASAASAGRRLLLV